jgi:hypothetical protein
MNFILDLDEKRCKHDNKACPISNFDVVNMKGECKYYNSILAGKDGWYLRCPECLAEEKRQKNPIEELFSEDEKQKAYKQYLDKAYDMIKNNDVKGYNILESIKREINER